MADRAVVATPKQVRTAGLASLFAWSFDLFDLFIILFVAATIGPLLFPSDQPTLSQAAVYASFAVTVLMRPLGAALFGSYADKHGRKRAMIVAVFGVGTATALMGAVPTYAQAGLVAPLLFLALRVIQGIFVGGVVASTHTIGTETVEQKYRGLMSGLIGGGGASLGAVFASIVLFVVSSIFPGEAFSEWGWRVMFFTGIIGAIASLFIFRAVEESPMWQEEQREHHLDQAPVRHLFSREYRAILMLNVMLVGGAATQYYLVSGYLPNFLEVQNEVPRSSSAGILIVANLIILVAALAVGHLSEQIGRKRTFMLVGVVNLILVPLLYLRLADLGPQDKVTITLYAMALAFLANAAYAPVLIFLNERFPTRIRATGTGLSWNMGFAIGGVMPTFVSLASPSVEAIPSRLAIFLVTAILIYLIAALLVPETRGNLGRVQVAPAGAAPGLGAEPGSRA
jgi:MFS family permease